MTRGVNPDQDERASRAGEGSVGSSDDAAYGTYFLGRYRVVDEIGVGGMASVHLARMDGAGGFQKWVAIKKIHPHLTEDEQFIHMFLDEARIAARISHPNVAQVFDLGEQDHTYWIAMEYLHGEPLREVMRSNEDRGIATRPELAARIVADAAEGLHAAHELRGKNGEPLNLVHRDVSPHNLFVTYDGMVKVVDFGIAKVSGRLSSTRAGTLKGKLAYMSPEQVRGSAIDRRTDIFALGVVLWELTTGQRLFRMDSDLETLEKVQACIVPPPSSVRPDFPAELESVVMRTLQRRPEMRFQTARELSRALQQFLMHAGSFVGPEDVSAHVTGIFGDRIKTREAHLRWAADVTQTISIDDIRSGARSGYDELSLNSYESASSDQLARPIGSSAVTARPPRGMPSAEHATQAESVTRALTPEPPNSSGRLSAPQPARQLPPAHGIHMPAQRVRPELAAQPANSVVIANSPTYSPSFPMTPHGGFEQEDEELATIVVPSRLALEAAMSGAPMPAAGSSVNPYAPPNSFAGYAPQHQEYAPQPAAGYPPNASYPGMAPSLPAAQSSYLPPGVPQYAQPFAPALGFSPPGVAPRRADETVQLSAARRGSNVLVYVAAAAGTFFVVVGLAAVILLRARADHRSDATTATATAVAATTTALATATTATAATTVGGAPTAPPAATGNFVPPAATTAGKTASVPPPPPPATTKPGGTPTKGPPAPPTPPAVTDKGEPGFLTVVCSPYCDSVSAGGRGLGPSPVVHVPFPPGQYTVVLKRTGGASKAVSATIVSGRVTSHRVSME